MGLGSRLKEVLKDKKLKQNQFAKEIDENLTQLNKVLNDQRPISIEMLTKVAKRFPDLDINWLFREDAERRRLVNEEDVEKQYYTPKHAEHLLGDIEYSVERLRKMLPEE